MNANYRKGRAREWKTITVLGRAGWPAFRTAGSHGPFDVFALGPTGVRLIQVKSGSARLSPVDREKLKGLVRPPNATLEVWRWPDRSREPFIEVVT